MEQSGISKLALKRTNRMQILKLLKKNGPTSRIDISRALSLTRAAVTIITNEMIGNGVLYRKGEVASTNQKPTRGRKKVLIDIAPNYKFVFGVLIDQNVISVGISNLNGEILGKRSERLPDMFDNKRIIASIVKHVKDIIAESCLNQEQILGLGLCISASHFDDLGITVSNRKKDFSYFTNLLEEQLKFKVVAEELVNSLALADIDFGDYPDGEKPSDIMFVRYRNDLSASIIIDNEIYYGANNKSALFGHMLVKKDEGEPCPICGKKGCLDSLISGKVLQKKISVIYSEEQTPHLFSKLGPDSKAPGIRALEESELFVDDSVIEIITESTNYLARGIVNTVKILDPEKIVLYGKMFENRPLKECIMDNLSKLLDAEIFKLITCSAIKTKTEYLAGCSTAVRKLFIESGGLL